MNRRALYIGILAAAVLGLGGCKKLLRKATGTTPDICALLKDAEIESAMGLKVESHKGDEDSCEWNLGSPAEPGIVTLMKSSEGAEAVLNATLGKGTPVEGVGDSAKAAGLLTAASPDKMNKGMVLLLLTLRAADLLRCGVLASTEFFDRGGQGIYGDNATCE